MNKIIFLGLLLCQGSYALDRTGMFFTPEPYNMYSEPIEEKEKKKEEDPIVKDEDGTIPLKDKLKGGDLFFNAYYGYMIYTGYNRPGTAITVSVEKYFPKIIESFPGIFVEGDFAYAIHGNTDGAGILPEATIHSGAAYAGYMIQMNDKTFVRPKVGLAYLSSPVSSLAFAWGASIVRKLSIKAIELVGDLTSKGSVMYFNVGVRYKYPGL